MNEIKVPFMIWGNPLSNAGYNPIFYFNRPTFTAPADISPSGMAENDYFFTVTISPAFTTIVLTQNNVKSAGASREGTLKFAMALPKGMRLRGGKTPYEVLTSMRDYYVANYMDPIRGQVPGFRFRESNGPAQPLQAILDSYSLEPANLPHRPMSGQTSGFIRVGRQQMHDFFSDLQYPEFHPFKEIVVAEKGELNPHVGISDIPRVPKWKLLVNNVPSKWPQSNPMARMRITDNSKNPVYWDNISVDFSIEGARRGEYPFIRVDEASETINVSISPVPKEQRIRVIQSGAATDESGALTFRTPVSRQPLKIMNGYLTLKGEEIDKPVEVRSNDPNLLVTGSRREGDTLNISLKRRSPATGRQNIYSKQESNTIDLPIEIEFDKKANRLLQAKAIVERNFGHGREGYSELIFFNILPGTNRISSTLRIPESLTGQVKVTLKNDRGTASTSMNLAKNPPAAFFSEKQFVKRGVKSPGMLSWILIIAALIGGFACGWILHSFFGTKPEQENTVTSDIEDWYMNEDEWNDITMKLDDPGLTFATVEELYNKVSEARQNENFNNVEELHKATTERIEGYRAAVNAVKSHDLEQLKSTVHFLNENHASMIKAAYEGWKDNNGEHKYTAEAIEKAKDAFVKREFNSFLEIQDIHIGLQEYRADQRNANTDSDQAKAPKAGQSEKKTIVPKTTEEKKPDVPPKSSGADTFKEGRISK